MKLPKKNRLDLILVEKGLATTRQRAQALILAGKVLVDDRISDKPGALISKDTEIVLKSQDLPYVSRGGLKLEKALKNNEIDVTGLVCLDVGASTGGFTDCLLQFGARRVFAVDVGYGQLAWKLRRDARVEVIERTNIRYLSAETLSQRVDLATIDVSFISLKIVVPAVLKFLKKDASILALIKPQFEVGKGRVAKGGIVRDPYQHAEVIRNLSEFFSEQGLLCRSVFPSPLLGAKGNKEFFIHLNFDSMRRRDRIRS